MIEVRHDEPEYAFIPQVDVPEKNRWGKKIETIDAEHKLRGKSLNINSNPKVGTGANRYKQHGFHFTADNCIGCHACEAACSEKNDLPAHISFRSVGYVEGGSFPAYKRLNISMACNHCDNPVCLKGCPTRAYTKFAEYGAVLQDPDICFGCGYCTWVCPYNAPQLDPIKGQVSKCNMCVDRLEEGLKPACAAACLGGALDFGIIESKPENREQAEVKIPGFPTPEISHPNIRFQQTKTLPREMKRPDTMPIRYHQDEQGRGEYKVKPLPSNKPRTWNIKKLRSREDPLVIFTLITQAVVGAFITLFLFAEFGGDTSFVKQFPQTFSVLLFALIGLQSYGLATSTMHLGKPHRFYRAFNNLKYSPVSREVAAIAVFFIFLTDYAIAYSFPQLLSWLPQGYAAGLTTLFGWGALAAGPIAIYAMHKIYRIKARPYWNHWQVLTAFYGNVLALGPLLVLMVFASVMTMQGVSYAEIALYLGFIIAAGLIMEGFGLVMHMRYLHRAGGEAAASALEQEVSFGKTYLARNFGLAVAAFSALLLAMIQVDGQFGLMLWSAVACIIVVTALVGRALFYVMVIPTTMPGAFFWRNKGFQEHARETGLAHMPQVGVLPDLH